MSKKLSVLQKIYQLLIIVLAIISVSLTLLDLTDIIDLTRMPFSIIDGIIWLIFVLDYAVGLFSAHSKRAYVRTHVMDLLAIMPVNLFNLFRFARIFRILRLLRIFRMAGIIGKLQEKLKGFLRTNGFMYLLYASITILITISAIYSTVEGISLGNAFWWAITTATTVGYGDIAPHTALGKVLAVILMLVGVGFVGMLTSTLTAYFTNKTADKDTLTDQEVLAEFAKLHRENEALQKQLTTLTKTIQTAQKN
ncbi:potassium channel family protein [Furfurilactobacillus siliginis]|uniref:Ion transporter n=2 Tax=Furfurilactobacillus siliginis TaxID=348151 RepID=A0A510VN29_9LACO|nr:potassium channel family protein [Furfurilactobacillus siliginis]GEK28307.1 ion transporter [Furfurilactobacillus siliginis]